MLGVFVPDRFKEGGNSGLGLGADLPQGQGSRSSNKTISVLEQFRERWNGGLCLGTNLPERFSMPN